MCYYFEITASLSDKEAAYLIESASGYDPLLSERSFNLDMKTEMMTICCVPSGSVDLPRLFAG